MATALQLYYEMKSDELMHYGVQGQRKGKHDPNRRWQRDTVYAMGRPDPNAKVRGQKKDDTKGERVSDIVSRRMHTHKPLKKWGNASENRPNPDAKVRGQKEDSIRLPGFRRGLSSDELQREIDKKSTSELKEAANRLNAEKEYKYAVINNMKATSDYNDMLNAGHVKVGKKFTNAIKGFSRSDIGKDIIRGLWTRAKYAGYESMAKKHGDEMARTVYGSILKFNDDGGKKKPKGGGNQQKDQSGDKKDQQKDQNGGN